MNFKTFKTLAVVGASVLAVGGVSDIAKAADNADVTASITTSSTISAANGVNMDFGTFLIGVHSGDSPTITMDADTGAFTLGALGTSQVSNVLGTPGTPGTATITLPNGADGVIVQMSLDTINDFANAPVMSVTAVSYRTATEAEAAVVAGGATVPVTNVTGAVAETISFGATITATDTPADGAHTASLDVSFDY